MITVAPKVNQAKPSLKLDLNNIEGCFDKLGFKKAASLDINPFEVVEEELTSYLDKNLLLLLSGITPTIYDEYVRDALRVPFGSELVEK